jgi:hypothetical protein
MTATSTSPTTRLHAARIGQRQSPRRLTIPMRRRMQVFAERTSPVSHLVTSRSLDSARSPMQPLAPTRPPRGCNRRVSIPFGLSDSGPELRPRAGQPSLLTDRKASRTESLSHINWLSSKPVCGLQSTDVRGHPYAHVLRGPRWRCRCSYSRWWIWRLIERLVCSAIRAVFIAHAARASPG